MALETRRGRIHSRVDTHVNVNNFGEDMTSKNLSYGIRSIGRYVILTRIRKIQSDFEDGREKD